MTKRSSVFAIVGIILIVSTNCATDPKRASGKKDAIMFGMLYDYENNPVKGVAVSIDGTRFGETDVMGRFTIVGVQPGGHRLLLEKEGYEKIEDSFVFDPLSMLYYRMITASQLIAEAERALAGFDYNVAQETLDRALKLEPFRYDALYLQAVAYFHAKEYENAKKKLDNLKGLGYTGIYSEKLFYKIEECRPQ